MPDSRVEGAPRAVPRALVLSWIGLYGLIAAGLIGPNRTAIEQEFGLSHGQFGAAFAAIQMLAALAALAFSLRPGFDSFGALVLSLGVQAAGFAGVFASRGLGSLAVGWTLITYGTLLGAVANNLSGRLWPGELRKGLTLLHGWNAVGKVCGPLLAAACFAIGWRMSFLAAGVLSAALLVAFWSCRRAFAAAVGPDPVAPAGALAVLRRPFYWLCVLPFALISGGELAWLTILPVFYERVRHLTPGQAALLLTVNLAGQAAGRFLCALWLNDRLSNSGIIAFCLATGAAALPAVFSLRPAVWVLTLFIQGVMYSSTWPAYYAQIAPHYRETPQALDYGTGLGNALGAAIFVALVGRVADRSLTVAMLIGPVALWGFGAVYAVTPLCGRERRVRG